MAGLQRHVTAAILVIKNNLGDSANKNPFSCKIFVKKKKHSTVWTTNMATLSRGCKPRIAGDY